MSHARSLARRYAVQAVYQWQLGGQFEQGDEPYYVADKDRGRIDRAYYHALTAAVVEHHAELDRQLAGALDRAVNEVNPVELAILRIGVCEFLYYPDVPYRVVINEAVELAKRFGAENAHKYVNGILDTLAARLRAGESGTHAGSTSG